MSTSPSQIFTGSSSYATDFQAVIDRAVAIASLPLNQYQSQKSDMSAQSAALTGLDGKFAALQTAVQNLDTATGPASYTSSSSAPSSVRTTVGTGALPGTFTLDVVSLGSSTSTVSNATLPAVSDPFSTSISASANFTLTVNGTAFSIQPKDGSLVGLAQAINSSAGNVQASIVNTGSSGAPNYRLAIRSAKLGADTVQLNDGTSDLLDTLSTGAKATYRVNGLSTLIESDSRTVTLAPGVSAELLQATSNTPVTISVERNADSIQSGITAFVDAYNGAVDAIDAQRGKNAGALTGQSIVNTLNGVLRQITQYNAGSGSGLDSLAELGVTLDSQGKLTFDSSKLDAGNPNALLDFLGSTSSSGFLKAASDTLELVENSSTGSVKQAEQSLDTEMRHQDDLIAATQDRIDNLKTSLQERIAAADAAIAALEQQVKFMNALFQAMSSSNSNNNNKN